MTIIAYRDGIMASDSGVTSGNIKFGWVKKIIKTKGGLLVGASGTISGITNLINISADAEKITDINFEELIEKEINGFIVEKDETVWCLSHSIIPFKLEAPFHAEGSGAPVALGAMYMGANASQAVEAAIQFDLDCYGPIQSKSIWD